MTGTDPSLSLTRATGPTALVIACLILLSGLSLRDASAQELIIGREHFDPGILAVVEAAPRDDIRPGSAHLGKEESSVHIETRLNWASDSAVAVPEGAPRGGFIPYAHIHMRVTHENSGKTTFVSLTPHITLGGNLHYARNMALPGPPEDAYRIDVTISPPQTFELSFHSDWRDEYGTAPFERQTFTYREVHFGKVLPDE